MFPMFTWAPSPLNIYQGTVLNKICTKLHITRCKPFFNTSFGSNVGWREERMVTLVVIYCKIKRLS